jgi:hypothetical protein
MKAILSVFAVLLVLNVSSCNRSSDDVTIEKQEDYESDDVRESRDLPLERDDEIKADRDFIGDDEFEIDD